MANTVQSNLASGILNEFHVEIGMNLQTKLQDWPSRQQLEYAAIKGLMVPDWHGLSDFYSEMTTYSSTNIILRIAWSTIQNIVPYNPSILSTLVNIPGFGLVGQAMLSLVGIQNILVTPQNILQNQNTFNSTISSVS